jgi:hypothetical protein
MRGISLGILSGQSSPALEKASLPLARKAISDLQNAHLFNLYWYRRKASYLHPMLSIFSGHVEVCL